MSSLVPVSDGAINNNLLYNPDFKVAQRGAGPFTSTTTPANNDYTVLADCWRLISDGNDIVDVSIDYNVYANSGNTLYPSLKFDVETANKKFGVISWLESIDVLGLRGKSVSLSFLYRAAADGSTFNNVKACLVQSVATADSLGDPVSTWNAGGTDPTLSANFSFIGTPVSVDIGSGTLGKVVFENISIPTSSVNNLGVMIWHDAASTTVGHTFNISKVKLELGSFATEYSALPIARQSLVCQRYFLSIGGSTNRLPATGRADGTSTGFWTYPLGTRMRTAPGLSIVGTGSFQLNDGSVQLSASSIATNFSSDQCVAANFTMSASTFTLYRTLFGVFSDATTYLWATAEL